MKVIFKITFFSFLGLNLCFAQKNNKKIAVDLLVKLVNDARNVARECGDKHFDVAKPLKWNNKLACAAENHSVDMNKNEYFNHTSLNGKQPWDRAQKCGYTYRSIGENIAYSTNGTEKEIIEMWLESPGHCANIMNPDYTEFGIGKSGIYWTQVLASPK